MNFIDYWLVKKYIELSVNKNTGKKSDYIEVSLINTLAFSFFPRLDWMLYVL